MGEIREFTRAELQAYLDKHGVQIEVHESPFGGLLLLTEIEDEDFYMVPLLRLPKGRVDIHGRFEFFDRDTPEGHGFGLSRVREE